jgi:outer membrane protein assembly factor BamB
VLGQTSPAALDWTVQPAAGSRLTRSSNDGIELASDVMAATTWAGLKVPRPGLYEIVFRLGEASAATGVYLGDDAGKPLHVLGIVRDQRTKQPVLQFLRPDAGGFEIGTDINQLQVPFIGPGQWLRLITGSGTIKCWTSGDGVHWSRALDPLRGLRGGWSHVGLMSFKWTEPRRITLEHLHVSELAAVSELADEKLCVQVPAAVIAGDPNPPAWLARVNDSLPAGIDLAPWRTACTFRTVAAIPPSQLGNAVLNVLAEEILVRQVPAARRMHALDQIAELYDGWEPPDSFRLSQFYERLGKQLMREGDRRPWTDVGRFLATAPIWTHAQFQTVHESLANAELLYLIYGEEWNSVRQLCRELTFLNRPGPPEQSWPDNRQRIKLLVEWSRATADRDRLDRLGADKPRQSNTAGTIPFHWQHPLVANLSKEGFNTLSDLEATLAEKSYREACQIISSARPELTTGLLPDGGDARLLLSLPQAVETAMRDDPALLETMVEQFGTTGRLRLQQALVDGNARQVQALTVQFSGTPAAAAAHAWLGNRALEIGDFAWASAEFEHGLRSADREQRPAIAAHWRLAAALLGRDAGEPATEPVVFQSTRLEPDAFEKLVAEMKQRAVAKGNTSPAIAETAPGGGVNRTGVKAVRYEIVQRASLRGDVGDQPGNPVSGEVDWAARQIACTVSGPMLYFTNRFQVAALNLKTGQQFWSQPVGKEQGPAHGWGLCPSRPVVSGDSLLVRRLAKTNPELACFNVATGIIRWTTRNTVIVISDPLVVQDRLFVFTTTSNESGLVSIDFSLVDPASGEIVAQQPVIQLRNVWDRQLSCQAAVVGTRIVAVCGGNALCCDFAGRPLWVRRQQWIPPAQAPAANEQSPNVPLAIGNRLFVTQPGVFAVECLDLDTGRRVWQEPIPDLRRLIGIAGPRLVIETARGWQAHASDSGKQLWQHEGEQVLDAQICPASGDLLVAQRESQPNDQSRAVFVWLSAETGRETARQPLALFVDKQPMLGPLVVDGDHLWTFFGRGVKDPYRDLFELTPTADPAQAPRTASIGQ